MIKLLAAAVVFSVCLALVRAEDGIKNIVVFGDSYSDVGNKQKLSNGPLWHEHLAVGWKASLYSFAFSGAVCNNDMYTKQQQQESYIPSIVDQVEMYYKQNMSLKAEETVVVFWVGVNDIYKVFEETSKPEKQQKELAKVVECISTNIRNMRRVFSNSKFIVFGVPPLESMPYYANTDMVESREKAANDLNDKLTKEVEKMNKHLQNLELDMVDIHQLLDDIVRQPELFNIKNTQDPYWDACQGKCSDDIDSYVWWDKTHLTGGIHRLIANSILMAGSLSPETYLEDDVDVKTLLEPYKSPTYKAAQNTGEINKLIQSLNEQAQQNGEQAQSESDLLEDKIAVPENKSFVFYGITATVIVSVAFILFVKTKRRRSNLSAFSNLLKNKDRGQFVPLRNLDSEV